MCMCIHICMYECTYVYMQIYRIYIYIYVFYLFLCTVCAASRMIEGPSAGAHLGCVGEPPCALSASWGHSLPVDICSYAT